MRQVMCVWLMGLGLLLGCGQDNPLGRRAVSGTVKLDGEPVAQGEIMFVPQKSGAVLTGATITNGAYSIEKAKGLPPGEYGVNISAPDKEHLQPPPVPGLSPIPKELIPEDYNVKSTKTVTVTEEGPNQFDFDINSR